MIRKLSSVYVLVLLGFVIRCCPMAESQFSLGTIQRVCNENNCYVDLPSPYVTACHARADTPLFVT